ncbi:MAG: hypothetical protein IJU75_00080 [Clostridia bacterium]|nr:hypothetical protein [Clostridia bacterium]
MKKLSEIIKFQDHSNIKVEFNRDDGTENRELMYKHWLAFDSKRRENGDVKDICFHNSKTKANLKTGMTVFSFAQKPGDKDLWVLLLVAEITKGEKNSYCDFSVLTEYKPYFGNLEIRFHKSMACRIMWLDTVIDKCTIVKKTETQS